MKFLPAGTILHWEFNHFVVFERIHYLLLHRRFSLGWMAPISWSGSC